MKAQVKKWYYKFIKFNPGINYQYRVANYKKYVDFFEGRNGIEIGGPSHIFENYAEIPVYPHIATLDGVNFSTNTVWEGHIESGKSFRFDTLTRTGTQFIGEASSLPFITDASYDFAISSNCLEHLANPLKAINEWLRIIKNNGALLIVVPHKDKTFDHRRPVTSLEHLIEDLKADTRENDMTHLEEVLALHDLSMDPLAGSAQAFKERSLKNLEIRCLHQHVFSVRLLFSIFDYLQLRILDMDVLKSGNIAILVRKSRCAANDRSELRKVLSNSPLPTDLSDLNKLEGIE